MRSSGHDITTLGHHCQKCEPSSLCRLPREDAEVEASSGSVGKPTKVLPLACSSQKYRPMCFCLK